MFCKTSHNPKRPNLFRRRSPYAVAFQWSGGSAPERLDVTGESTEVALPILPREPDRIEFNPHPSVLAEVDDEGW